MEFKDYYDIMGVPRDASHDDIKRAYRRLARKYHPDVSKEHDAEVRFKEMQEAYEVLKDPEKRAAFDRFGKDWKAGQDFHPPPDWDTQFNSDGGGFSNAGGFSDFFEALFGGARAGYRSRGFAMPGEDIHAKVQVSLEDAYGGATRTITLQVPEPDASGQILTRTRTLNVKIPQGVVEGQRIRLAGLGGPGIGGGAKGDLYLEILFAPNRRFRAEQRDIHLELPLTPWEIALGRTVSVPTLGGKVELKIPAGSPSGRQLRLKDKGLPGKPPGDQYVTLRIVTPAAKTEAAKSLYERMERELPMNPRTDWEA